MTERSTRRCLEIAGRPVRKRFRQRCSGRYAAFRESRAAWDPRSPERLPRLRLTSALQLGIFWVILVGSLGRKFDGPVALLTLTGQKINESSRPLPPYPRIALKQHIVEGDTLWCSVRPINLGIEAEYGKARPGQDNETDNNL